MAWGNSAKDKLQIDDGHDDDNNDDDDDGDDDYEDGNF